MPLQATSGAASYDAFGGGVPSEPNYIESVFSCFLYTGNGSTQTITNGIDLSTKGGLVWQKDRSQGTGYHHILQDTARGATNCLFTNLTNAQSQDSAGTGFVFNNNGFTIGTSNVKVNASGDNYTSWTFRKQPKFFDVVTYTGNGTAGRTVAHNLGSVPGCIIVKRTDTVEDWGVYHTSLGNTKAIFLNYTSASDTNVLYWNNTSPTSTQFSVGSWAGVNASGGTYVAYLFAHNAGGFGLTGTDNVISCGTYAGNDSGSGSNTINLGYEPQYLMVKRSSGGVGSWWVIDNMRGATADGNDKLLAANTTAAEISDQKIAFTATGFTLYDSSSEFNALGSNYIYIAIRRGPMKVPTSGTSVLDVETYTGTQAARTITTANTVDLSFTKSRSTAGTRWNWTDRLRGATKTLDSSLTAAEASDTTGYTSFAVQQGYTLGTGDTYDVNTSGRTYVSWNLTRSPSFFDEVCYTGNNATQTLAHNLGAVPEMMIVKTRNTAASWRVYVASLGNTSAVVLNSNGAVITSRSDFWDSTTPTSTNFTVGSTNSGSTYTYVNYLFATCAGVSKVGSYTGTGTTIQVDCGFTGGARFVLIKRTDSTGDWYVWDTARGIVSGNDPYLLLNSTAAEVTNTDYIDTYSAGFEISSTAPAAINASGGTFIFLAIA